MMKHAVTVLHPFGRTRQASVTQVMARAVDTLLMWQDRARQRYRLRQFDDRMLSDIGLSRADVDQESAKPFWLP